MIFFEQVFSVLFGHRPVFFCLYPKDTPEFLPVNETEGTFLFPVSPNISKRRQTGTHARHHSILPFEKRYPLSGTVCIKPSRAQYNISCSLLWGKQRGNRAHDFGIQARLGLKKTALMTLFFPYRTQPGYVWAIRSCVYIIRSYVWAKFSLHRNFRRHENRSFSLPPCLKALRDRRAGAIRETFPPPDCRRLPPRPAQPGLRSDIIFPSSDVIFPSFVRLIHSNET
jgi:hypothetical protein